MKTNNYLFTSTRLGFRNWNITDVDALYEINTDEKVMEFFPTIPSKEETSAFITRMQNQFKKSSFCYFAVDLLESEEFIGFIGLCEQTYEASFTPCTDIGWRIKSSEWNKGYATEGAKRCLEYAFETLQLKKIYAIAPKLNIKSEHIMVKIGMNKEAEFEHPALINYPELKTCVLYSIES